MVEGGLAVVEDTRLVGRPVGGIDSDGNGSTGKFSGQSIAVIDILESSDLEWASILGAGLLDSLVGVLILMNNSVVPDVLEGIVHKTSVAGLVSI